MKKFRLESQAELVALADQVAWPTSRTGVCIMGFDTSAKGHERRLLK
jgi:hypothetical protein